MQAQERCLQEHWPQERVHPDVIPVHPVPVSNDSQYLVSIDQLKIHIAGATFHQFPNYYGREYHLREWLPNFDSLKYTLLGQCHLVGESSGHEAQGE